MPRAGGLRSFTWLSGWGVFLTLVLVGILGTAVESMTLDVPQGEVGCVVINAAKGDKINSNYEVLTPRSMKSVMVVLRSVNDGRLLYKMTGLMEDYMWADATEAGDYELCFLNGASESIAKLANQNIDQVNGRTGLDALRQKKRQEDEDAEGERRVKVQNGDDDTTGYSQEMWGRPEQTSYTSDDFDSWYSADPPTTTFGFGLRLGQGPDMEAINKDPGKANDERLLADEAELLVMTLSAFGDHESYVRGREEWHSENMSKTSSRLWWCTLIEAAVLVWMSWFQLSYIRRFFETKRIL